MSLLKKCMRCNSYTLMPACEAGHKTVEPRPAKYSPLDTYGKYRRLAKQEKK